MTSIEEQLAELKAEIRRLRERVAYLECDRVLLTPNPSPPPNQSFAWPPVGFTITACR